jgi:hypothetical protein
LTYQGFEYEQRYVEPFMPGTPPEEPLFNPPPASEEPEAADSQDNDE